MVDFALGGRAALVILTRSCRHASGFDNGPPAGVAVAQLVARRSHNAKVVRSILTCHRGCKRSPPRDHWGRMCCFYNEWDCEIGSAPCQSKQLVHRNSYGQRLCPMGISGPVVEYIAAMGVTRDRFLADTIRFVRHPYGYLHRSSWNSCGALHVCYRLIMCLANLECAARASLL